MKFAEGKVCLLLLFVFIFFTGCKKNVTDPDPNPDPDPDPVETRADGAAKVVISQSGSPQNPAWSPDSKSILFTRFRNGYNQEPADIFIVDLIDNNIKTLISDGSGNVNLPGSSWNAARKTIIFSSTRVPHDEIYIINDTGTPGSEHRVTSRQTEAAFEPSFSPDGLWIVFESHPLDVEGEGKIVKYKIDGTGSYQDLTGSGDDCRQPNWSPNGDLILYQKFVGGQWDIWVMDVNGNNHNKITKGEGDKTDGSFSPNGEWLVYSSDEAGIDLANLFIIKISVGNPIRITNYSGYDGAPSWSPDDQKIAFESSATDPDGSAGTTIWTITVPNH